MIKITLPLIILLFCSSLVFGVNYNVPSRLLGANASSISKGTGLFENDPTSIFDIDASFDNKTSIGAFHVTTMDDVATNIIAIQTAFKRFTIGLGYASHGVNGIEKTIQSGLDNEHLPSGETYGYHNSQFKLSLSRSNRTVSFGLGANLYESKLDSVSGSGFGIDIGSLYQFSNRTVIALAITNLIATDIAFDTKKETLPLRYSIGLKNKLTKRLSLLASVCRESTETNSKNNTLFSAGLSYELMKSLQLNGSFFQKKAISSIKDYVGLGINLNLVPIEFQYGFRTVEYSESKNQHFFSINLTF